MDPISHGIIGASLFALFKEPSFDNPAFIGAIIGAIAPDFDIITKLKGDYVYLKHHRVESHSIAGLIPIAVTITLGLSILYTGIIFKEVFLWSLIGILSHIVFDYMNSYGVALLYPLTRKKLSINLITIYDPLVTLLCGYVLIIYKGTSLEFLMIAATLIGYLCIKYLDKHRLSEIISKHYIIRDDEKEISLMPSEYNPFSWNYILQIKDTWITGDICSFKRKPCTLQTIPKEAHPMIDRSLEEDLGLYFRDFTPFLNATITKDENNTCIKLVDLRYRINREFFSG